MIRNCRRFFFFSLVIFSCFGDECGERKIDGPLIVGGNQSLPGEWPWLVSLHFTRTKDFFCGSSLINEKMLVTAAHCVQSTPFYALLGRFNVSDETELNWVQRNISKIIVHEDYKPGDVNHRKSDADIAILIMDSPVQFTNYIQPICLPSHTQSYLNVDGFVAGYGRPARYEDPTKIPHHVKLSTVDLVTCVLSHSNSFQILSERSFCADSKTGIPCQGDGGSAFNFLAPNHKWTLLGIVSYAFNMNCRPGDKTAFVNVPLYIEWIKVIKCLFDDNFCPPLSQCKIINKKAECVCHAGLVMENSVCKFSCDGGSKNYDLSLKCDGASDCRDGSDENQCVRGEVKESFSTYIGWNRAIINFVFLPPRDQKIDSEFYMIASNHRSETVKSFLIEDNKAVNFLPIFIKNQFPNLVKFYLFGCEVKKVSKSSFEGLKKLEEINLHFNQIEIIEKNSFEDLEKLKVLELSENKLENLPENIFDNLISLEKLDLDNNKLKNLNENLFKNLRKLKVLSLSRNQIKILAENIFDNLISLEELHLHDNKLENLNENLFQNLRNLKELWLSLNQIKILPENIFDNLISLEELDLYRNDLENLNENLIQKLRLRNVRIS